MDFDPYRSAPRASAIDARHAYPLFLGRVAESRQVLASSAGLPFGDMVGGFLHSEEFGRHVLHPVLHGEPAHPGRFQGRPSRRLRSWAAQRLAGAGADPAAIRAAASWTTLWTALLHDAALQAAFAGFWGQAALAGFRDGLALRIQGLGMSSPADRPELDTLMEAADANGIDAMGVAIAARFAGAMAAPGVRHAGPPFSILVLATDGGDRLGPMVESLLDQTYARWELILVDTRRGPGASLVLGALEGLNGRIRLLALDEATPDGPALLAALDVAVGGYVAVLEAQDRLSFDALEQLSRATTVHDRPHVLYGDRAWLRADGSVERLDPLPAWSPLAPVPRLAATCAWWRIDTLAQALARCDDELHPLPSLQAIADPSALRVAHVEAYIHGRMAPPPEPARPAADHTLSGRHPAMTVVLTGGRTDELAKALLDLAGSGLPPETELLAIAPAPDLDALLQLALPRTVRLMACEPFLGRASRRAMALQATTRDLVVFLDAEVRPHEPDWLRRLQAAFSRTDVAAAGFGVQAPASATPDPPGLVARALDGLALEFGLREVSLLDPRAFAIRREAVEAVRGFDPAVPPDWAELDLFLRLKREGLRLLRANATVNAAEARPPEPRGAAALALLRTWGHRLAHDPFYTPAMRAVFGSADAAAIDLHMPAHAPAADALSAFVWADAAGADELVEAVKLRAARGEFVVAALGADGPLRRRLVDAGALVLVSASVSPHAPWWSELAASFDRILAPAAEPQPSAVPLERLAVHVG